MSQEFESPPRADVPASGRQVFAVGSDLAELCAEAVIVWSLVGVVRAWNASAERLYGRPAEAAVGQDIDALLAPPGFAPHPLARARVRSHGRWSGQLRRRAAQGGEQMVQVRWTLQVDAAGQPDAIIEFSQGLDQDEAFQRFKANEERYRDLFLRAPVPLMLADAHGVSQLVRELKAAGVTDTAGFLTGHPEFLDRALDIVSVAEVNERAISVFGARQASDLVGPVRPLWVDSPDTFLRALIARIDGAAYFAEETRMRTFDGRTVDILFSLAFPPPDQYAGAALMGLQDITDRRRAETQLEKLRSNLAHGARVSTLGELTASLAHELTQPLAAIATNGHATLGWLDKTPPNVGRARERALRIVADAHRAGEIIKRFRAMATNRAPEDFALSLNEVVQEALLFLRHDLDERGVAVSTDLADGLPMARGDRVQLQQVIVNLTINSMQALAQAASRRSAIKLRTYVDAGGRVGFSIHDTGPGIPEDHLDHIFAGFFTTKTEGMGMGLAICQSIIVAHGGELEVSNLADGGACFSFSLPAASEDHAGS
jgi:signal transduction histidine kinase